MGAKIAALMPPVSDGEKTLEQMAYEDLQKFRKCSDVDIDYKAELARARTVDKNDDGAGQKRNAGLEA